MIRRVIVVSILVVGLLMAGLSQASTEIVETQDLIVSDDTGKLSNDQLKGLAEQAQALLNRIHAFWSADSGMERFGKIRVVFDVPLGEIYSSFFFWDKKDGEPIRVVRVSGFEGSPQVMAHKLTSAVFPQEDKLIRNIMGIIAEEQVGNPLSFPDCGLSNDDWVLALLKTNSYIPLNELGPDHESWGMKDTGGGNILVLDKTKQHKAYAEAGSFGNYLFQTYGIKKIKRFHQLSREKNRPWQEAFGIGLPELEANWLKSLKANEKTREENASIALKLEKNFGTACAESQKLAMTGLDLSALGIH
ncbi:MAG: hypothetical protein LUQ38_10965 [Methanotrichaceae archaeon]|nr:hypothetical protein [Methanotrichaceae archaeon]